MKRRTVLSMLGGVALLPGCGLGPHARSDDVTVGARPVQPLHKVRHLTVVFEPMGLDLAEQAGPVAVAMSGWMNPEKARELRTRVLDILARNGIAAEVLARERAGAPPKAGEREAAYVLQVKPVGLIVVSRVVYGHPVIQAATVRVKGSVRQLGKTELLLQVGGLMGMDARLRLDTDRYMASVLNAMGDHGAPPLPRLPVELPEA